jgi:branched-chain amino acid transport system permease protein
MTAESTDPAPKRVWRNPIADWEQGDSPDEVPTPDWVNPQDVWAERTRFPVTTYKVGRLRYYWRDKGSGAALWSRWRYWPTRRRVLDIRGKYNPKNLRLEKVIQDRRPIYWLLGFIALALLPLFVPETMTNQVYSAASIFGIYAAINLCWMLVVGTAGVFSLATYAVVGAAAYGSAFMSIEYGMPWWTLPVWGAGVGLVFGVVLALPALRLDGFYYALLTLGVNELCRVYVIQSRTFGSATGGLYGADSYIPESWSSEGQLIVGYYACIAVMLAALALHRFVNGKRLGRLLRMAPEKKEAFAEAVGVDWRRARIAVFVISSIALGALGGFYAAHFRGASPSLFSFDTVLLGLAMLVIGGLGRSDGAVVGTFIVVAITQLLLDLGPLRLVLVGAVMLGSVLFLRGGLMGARMQFRAWRNKKKSENRSTRTEKGGELLPEEATETANKDHVYFYRFDKMQREYLKRLVCPEVIEEHRRQPLGQHSEALERLLLYFRRHPQEDKYAVECLEPFKAYRIVAFSGQRGVAPRVVEDKVYASETEAYHGVFLRRVQDLMES